MVYFLDAALIQLLSRNAETFALTSFLLNKIAKVKFMCFRRPLIYFYVRHKRNIPDQNITP